MENQLELIVQESGLEKTKAEYILEKFQDYFKIAAEWEQKAKTIVVTDEGQIADMKMARIGRLELREKRIAVEKVRKTMKEQSLREGKAIDGIANVLKGLIIPIEEYLDTQEHFVEIREKERLEVERLAEEERLEKERIAKEKAEAEERERIRVENEQLKKEAEEREEVLRKEREAAEAERQKQAEILRKQKEKAELERKKQEEALVRQREEAEAEKLRQEEIARQKLEKKRQEHERVEAELKAKQEEALRKQEETARQKLAKEREARERVEAELKAKQEAEEKRWQAEQDAIESQARASDGEKLIHLAQAISSIQMPDVKSKTAQTVIGRIKDLLSKAILMLTGE